MTSTHLGRHQLVVALAVLPVFALGGAAQAQSDEVEDSPPAQPEAAPPPKAEPQPAVPRMPAVEALPAAPAQASPGYIEHMGPDTFPGRSRGLYGGSLWLEPSFHGLQWPQNSHTGLGVSGVFWVDSGYEAIKRNLNKMQDSAMYLQHGRGLLRVTPAYVNGDFFIQGQAELVGTLCQSAAGDTSGVCNTGTFNTDDLWIRVGQWNSWDVKVGRFDGWEIYHLGMGMDRYTLERVGARMFGAENPSNPALDAPALYGVGYLHDRPSDGLAVGYAAIHYYPIDFLRFELLGKLGADNYLKEHPEGGINVTSYTYWGGRPTAIFDIGWLKIKAGGEYEKRTPVMQVFDQTGVKKDTVEELTHWGAGASVQVVVDPIVEFGINGAYGKQSYIDTTANEFGKAETKASNFATKSFGGFANARVVDGFLVGVGGNWTAQEDTWKAEGSGAYDYTTHIQGFLALQYLLAKQLYIKGVLAYARAKFQPTDITQPIWSNDMYSGRLRLMYVY